MFLPIHSCYFHYLGKETDLPKLSKIEKATIVFLTISSAGGLIGTAALFICSQPRLAFFLLGTSSVSFGAYVYLADSYRYKILKSQTFLEDDLLLNLPKQVKIAESKSVLPNELAIEEKNEVGTEIDLIGLPADLDQFIFFEEYEEPSCHVVKKAHFNLADHDLLAHEPILLSQLEFVEFQTKKKDEPEFNSESLYNYLINLEGNHPFEHIFKRSLSILSREQDLAKRRIAFLFLFPYLFKFVEEKKLKIDLIVVKKILEDNLIGISAATQEDVPGLKDYFPFIIEQGLFLAEPLLGFLSDASPEKKFFFDFLFKIIFTSVPYALREEISKYKKKGKAGHDYLIERMRGRLQSFSKEAQKEMAAGLESMEKRLRRERHSVLLFLMTIDSWAMPHLSHMCAKKDFSNETLATYFSGIISAYTIGLSLDPEKLETAFKKAKISSAAFEIDKKDLLTFSPFAASYLIEARKRLFKVLNVCEERIKNPSEQGDRSEGETSNKKKSKGYVKLIEDARKILDAAFEEMETYFPDKDPGIIFSKSQLLASAIWEKIKSQKDSSFSNTDLINFFIKPIESAGIDTADLRKNAKILIEKFTQYLNSFETEGIDLAGIIPIQDLLFVLLFGFFAVGKLYELRPFAKRHLPAFFEMMKDVKLKTYLAHEKKVKLTMKIFLGLLKPLNGTLLGSWPGKSRAIELALKGLFSFFESEIKNKNEKDAFRGAVPIVKFLVLGTFGSREKEKQALIAFKEATRKLYSKLYSLSIEEMLDQEKLGKHLDDVALLLRGIS